MSKKPSLITYVDPQSNEIRSLSVAKSRTNPAIINSTKFASKVEEIKSIWTHSKNLIFLVNNKQTNLIWHFLLTSTWICIFKQSENRPIPWHHHIFFFSLNCPLVSMYVKRRRRKRCCKIFYISLMPYYSDLQRS